MKRLPAPVDILPFLPVVFGLGELGAAAAVSATSRSNYRRVIDGFLEDHGHRSVDQMKREHVDAIVGKLADKPGAGIVLLKRMRTMIRHVLVVGSMIS